MSIISPDDERLLLNEIIDNAIDLEDDRLRDEGLEKARKALFSKFDAL